MRLESSKLTFTTRAFPCVLRRYAERYPLGRGVARQICKIPNYDDAARVLAKQFLRSGTSIGANCAEAKSAQSTKDFIHKYEIALKEAQEFKYWVEIMIEAEIVSASKFTLLLQEVRSIINILAATIKTLKKKNS